MFGVGSGEIILILVIAMLVVGPERMVTFARDAGEMLAKFRRETDSVTSEFKEALSLDIMDEKKDQAAPRSTEPKAVEGESFSVSAPSVPESSSPSIAPAASSFADSQVTRVSVVQQSDVVAKEDVTVEADGPEITTVLAMPEEENADQVDVYELTVIEEPEMMDDTDEAETTTHPVQNEG